MNFSVLFHELGFFTILILLAIFAGFIDAIVGGGGLIQLPALLINLPNTPLPTILGTSKISGFSGTSIAAFQYSKFVKYNFKLLITISLFTAIASYFGAKAVSLIDANKLKPIILVVLILISIYTFLKKDFGTKATKNLSLKKQFIYGSLIGFFIGFYDGFLGPGTGSFLVLGFVIILGFDFITASGYSKFVNCISNISALIVFISKGNFILEIAIVMAVSNMIGSYFGTKIALKKGNNFIRLVFLIVLLLLIVRYGYDVFIRK